MHPPQVYLGDWRVRNHCHSLLKGLDAASHRHFACDIWTNVMWLLPHYHSSLSTLHRAAKFDLRVRIVHTQFTLRLNLESRPLSVGDRPHSLAVLHPALPSRRLFRVSHLSLHYAFSTWVRSFLARNCVTTSRRTRCCARALHLHHLEGGYYKYPHPNLHLEPTAFDTPTSHRRFTRLAQ